MAISELALNHAAFDMWLQSEGGDNLADIEKLKRYLPIVLDECVTVKQKAYIMHYFCDRMTIGEIAQRYGVHKSSVSRGIHRGLDTAYSYLRFVSPLFINAPRRRTYLMNGRAKP